MEINARQMTTLLRIIRPANTPACICLMVWLAYLYPASAAPLTGEELLKLCSSHTATPDRSLCEGFVTGVEAGVDTFTTGMRILHPGGNMFPALFCGANLASSDNLVAAAVSYLRHHPDTKHFGAASEVMLGLEQAFPCSK
jgi:hypothetical protein